LVRLGQQHQYRRVRGDPAQQVDVALADQAADVHRQDDAAQFGPLAEVASGERAPLAAYLPWRRGIAIAGRIDQVGDAAGTLVAEAEVVECLRAPGCAAREGEPVAVAQPVDGRGLAGVRAPDEGHLGQARCGQLLELGDGGEELGGRQERDAHARSCLPSGCPDGLDASNPILYTCVLSHRVPGGAHGNSNRCSRAGRPVRRWNPEQTGLAMSHSTESSPTQTEASSRTSPVARLLAAAALGVAASTMPAVAMAQDNAKPDRAAGEQIVTTVCAACHGP